MLIVDDEERARRVLSKLLENYCREVEVVSLCSNVPDAVQKVQELNPDAIFLDIEMPNYSGFELIEQLGDFTCDVVFVTAHNQYALQAFEVSAIDYLLKPVSIEKLEKAVKRLRDNHQNSLIRERFKVLQENLESSAPKRMLIPVIGRNEYVRHDSISHINADGSYCELFLQDEKRVVVSKKLKFFENQLKDNSIFFRCHRSHIVNIDRVKEFQKGACCVVMENGSVISVSRDKKSELLGILNS